MVPRSQQEGEDPNLSCPITENLNAVLKLLRYDEVSKESGTGSHN